jgi:hypothetical protein
VLTPQPSGVKRYLTFCTHIGFLYRYQYRVLIYQL